MKNRNAKTIIQGHKKAFSMIESMKQDFCCKLAVESLVGAVSAWDNDSRSRNLTGNTRTSFGSAVFRNKKLVAVFSVFDIDSANIEHPTSGMTFVGDSGFRVYGRNFYIDYDRPVQQYRQGSGLSFQPTAPGEYGYSMTSKFLRSFTPSTTDWVVVIACATPYGEYLRNVRKLDILDSQVTGGEVAKNVLAAMSSIKNIDNYEKKNQ